MTTIRQVPVQPQSLDRLEDIVGAQVLQRCRDAMALAAERLEGHTVWNINSTSEGGGVAEMIWAFLPYCLDAGWDVRWMVISGPPEFYDVTKAMHNALHGAAPGEDTLGPHGRAIYHAATRDISAELLPMVQPDDFALVHDPQPAGLIPDLRSAGAHVVWRCHIGTDTPNDHTRAAWDFLRPFITHTDLQIFSRGAYLWDGLDPSGTRVLAPAIDALSPKNVTLPDNEVISILSDAGVLDGPGASEHTIVHRVTRSGGELRLSPNSRIVLEVSRWDRLKDPLGFIEMFVAHLTDLADVHLVYAGPSVVADDPESAEVLAECEDLRQSLPPATQERVHLLSLPMDDATENALIVNALQRHATVVVQKSLQEGFGLTVAEAMWKSKPLVATRVGGIQDQIEHEVNGLLVDDARDLTTFALAVRTLLNDHELAERLGTAARQRVLERFLGTRTLVEYAGMVNKLTG